MVGDGFASLLKWASLGPVGGWEMVPPTHHTTESPQQGGGWQSYPWPTIACQASRTPFCCRRCHCCPCSPFEGTGPRMRVSIRVCMYRAPVALFLVLVLRDPRR